MTEYLPLIADNGFQLLIAIFLLYQYFNKKNQKTYKKKWIPVVVVVLVSVSTFLAYDDLREIKQKEDNNRMPTTAETKNAFEKKGHYALNEEIYKSEDGYTITIPKGFLYLPDRDGSLSFAAVREAQNTKYAITIARQETTGYVYNTVPKIIKELQSKYEGFEYTVSGTGKSRTIKFIFTDVDGNNKSTMLVSKRGGTFFVVSALAKNVPNEDETIQKELDRIVDSFNFI
ncbi:hypothetical protein JWG39_13575 [Desulforhopalus vacuolatus]|uniref:hypothetical protein n=1 Tax=Desulforhopalus vacuolatus TaxID=40414 RepID=UPI001966C94A|nr:hypothetical protein [Desulforhopalus vacuolatus]MBM9520847.1 hypothetical protein [Desulforhopalus vacuolatus]